MAYGIDKPSVYDVLQEMNNCSICLEEFTNPKLLPCGHTFCLGCLENIYSQTPFGNITCGICRNKHKVSEQGVAGFANDHRVQQIKDAIIKREPNKPLYKCVVCPKKASDLCLDCDEAMCHRCTTQHQARKHFSYHTIVKMIDSVECGQHSEKLAIRYCMSCSCLVCKVCIICEHSDHDISLLKMQDTIQPFPSGDPRVILKKLEKELQKNEAQYTANIQAIEKSSKDFKSAVEAQAQRLINIIQRNKQEIIKKSDDFHKGLRDDQYKQNAEVEKNTDQINKIKTDLEKKFRIYPTAGIIPEKVSLDSFKNDLEVIKLKTIPRIITECKFIPRHSLEVGELSVPDRTTRENTSAALSSPGPFKKTEDAMLKTQCEYETPKGFKDCPDDINMMFEDAFKQKKTVIGWQEEVDGASYRIDFDRMRERKFGDGVRLPPYWDHMKEEKCKRFIVPKQDKKGQPNPEYKKVEDHFKKTANATIVQIERVQNVGLYKSYDTHKGTVKNRNPQNIENERHLFHATSSPQNMEYINASGFSRSYSGDRAGCWYGKGVYFYRDANLSMKYARTPDDKNIYYMYRCKVNVGEFTKGKKDQSAPPLKPCSMLPYDSLVDDPQNPQQFVIFHDSAAYPEYIIAFKK